MNPQTAVNICNWRLEARPFQTWGPRTIPDHELICIHRGSFELELETGPVPARKNDLLCIRPGEKHLFKSLEPSGTLSCIHCDLPPELLPVRCQPVSDPEILRAFRRCAAVFLHPAPNRNRLLQTILTELLLRLPAGGPPAHTPSGRVAAMAKYIRDHYAEPVTRTTLSEKFHLTPQHINSLFKQELGISPTALLHLERCRRAFLLIQNEQLSVKEAAGRTGFCDAYHFSKVFKKTYGFAPGQIARYFSPKH